eukprot:2703747-Rhodomonas_salina.2
MLSFVTAPQTHPALPHLQHIPRDTESKAVTFKFRAVLRSGVRLTWSGRNPMGAGTVEEREERKK